MLLSRLSIIINCFLASLFFKKVNFLLFSKKATGWGVEWFNHLHTYTPCATKNIFQFCAATANELLSELGQSGIGTSGEPLGRDGLSYCFVTNTGTVLNFWKLYSIVCTTVQYIIQLRRCYSMTLSRQLFASNSNSVNGCLATYLVYYEFFCQPMAILLLTQFKYI